MMLLPYGREKLTVDIPSARVVTPDMSALFSNDEPIAIVRRAMAEPFGGTTLRDMARGKKHACLILSDHTRPVPSKCIVPEMLREMREGSPDIDITLLVATGCHRGTTREELVQKLGEAIIRSERILVHDSRDASSNVFIGTLPSGSPLVIDRAAAEADLLVSEGFIEPHFFAGFSGGRKSVLPGICDAKTVLGNHRGEFIASPFARTGVLADNPIHRDMVAAAKMAKLAYIVNVVLDPGHRVCRAFAGDPFAAHEAGCRFLAESAKAFAPESDIVITTNGGYPLDSNLYQCVKCMTAAEAVVRENGVIIVCAECSDGTGGDNFVRQLIECESPAAYCAASAATPPDETEPDQWQSQILCRVLTRARVIFVTRTELHDTVRRMKMIPCGDIDRALSLARSLTKPDASVTVIPDGVSVIMQKA